AEHQRRAALCPLRLYPGERPRRARRQRRVPARERGREGVLSRHRRRGPPLVPRRQALPPAQALALGGIVRQLHEDEAGLARAVAAVYGAANRSRKRPCPSTTTRWRPARRPS